ncbi:unnamed protein product (macronuclear) [Paramecium tetraurelia]|uniref:Uncharacterized protein n=1 Tax=Paramecium tetraurelia TaxID=5888 RepID=A0D017_PARTE|nr:uncharacterized protein GSPATT00039132001 [Paramecium tetraurelia]CAK76384.1 unnamed protein product [Paramecium tetraurelia]|eukprot:XP_001443781.1 hypothetical protein (macronuclear) [Paramecium tetraurelia strain d4-2]
MNILTSQIHKQKPDIQEMVCQIHKLEAIAIDLDTSEKGKFYYLCCNCLVEKMNNNKISTIQDANDRILSLKSQKKENKIKRDPNEIMNFKSTVDNTLEKLYSQIKAQIHTIQKEKQSVLESVQIQKDFLEDLKSLSEFLSADSQDKQFEFSSDDQFIDEVFKQFQLLFNNSEYFQTVDAFKEAKQKIIEVKENIKIELILQKNKNNQVKLFIFLQKTLSLNKACPTHNKEIIMIDIDTKNKNIQDRFVCVDCISDHPHCQYRTIEKIKFQMIYRQLKQLIIVYLKKPLLKDQTIMNQFLILLI